MPAFMLADTSPLRSGHYPASDTTARLDYERLARTIPGIAAIVACLAGSGRSSQAPPPDYS
jgi:hypothetical protein